MVARGGLAVDCPRHWDAGGNAKPLVAISTERKALASRPMERVFEAETREEANRKADEWWAKAKGMRFVHRCQTPPGFRSNPSQRWVIVIHYLEEVFPLERRAQTRVVR